MVCGTRWYLRPVHVLCANCQNGVLLSLFEQGLWYNNCVMAWAGFRG